MSSVDSPEREQEETLCGNLLSMSQGAACTHEVRCLACGRLICKVASGDIAIHIACPKCNARSTHIVAQGVPFYIGEPLT